MPSKIRMGAICAAALLALTASHASQVPAVRPVDEKALGEYAGVYRWDSNSFVYLQLWNEFTGDKGSELVAFDESGDVRTLYPTDRDEFFAGPGFKVAASVESRIAFHRDSTAKINSLTWRRGDAAPRTARRVEIEKRDDVRFSNGDVQLTGTLISPAAGSRHPADHSRPWIRSRESRTHAPLCPLPDTARHRGARIRQTGCRRIDRGLEHRLVRRSGGRRRGGV